MNMAQTPKSPLPLDFQDEPGSARSKWVAGLLGAGLILWMGSGYVFPPPPKDIATPVEPIKAIAVAVRDSEAHQITQMFSAEGQAQPDRRARLRAQSSGEVAELVARKGDYLEKGAVIARLDSRAQQSRVQQAQEELARAQREFDNAQGLLERGVAPLDRVTQARAALAAARAQLTQAEEALDATVIRAPFAGRLDALDLDEASYISAGDEVGTMLDTDPLTIVIQIPQQALSRISEGQQASVRFITGEERKGTVDYVSRDADIETRTFRGEILVANPDQDLASGLSAQVEIPTGTLLAHFISPAILSLDADGRLGVKTVNAENKVVFHEVSLQRAQTDGIWVGGLPERVRLITIGQGFVRAGETVAPLADDRPLPGPVPETLAASPASAAGLN